MKIIMPMAGRGTRLAGARGDLPKPLVPLADRPMLAWAMDSLRTVDCDTFIAVVLSEHERHFGISDIVREHWSDSPVEIVAVDSVPPGQLCSVLAAERLFQDDDILIAACDTVVVSSIGHDIESARAEGICGLISVAGLPGEHWSFARADQSGQVLEVAEKRRISEWASTGLYWFSDGTQFSRESKRLIRTGPTTNGEHYVIPVYGEYLKAGRPVRISQAEEVFDMGEPKALEAAEVMYANSHASQQN
ncbi:NTP transferase domain-containing protein [Nocardia sp. NPDC020380]|uniref:NTP transferase domain-containing protein n=1 Tax=Nocardia sp. NPDC020380 TaxID=3364309 RepID=UPI0037AF811A